MMMRQKQGFKTIIFGKIGYDISANEALSVMMGAKRCKPIP